MKTIKLLICIVFFTWIFNSCTTSTQITGSWKSDVAPQRTYQRVFIAALTGNTTVKATVENNLAIELERMGIQVTKSLDKFPPNFTDEHNDKDKMLAKIKSLGVDAILTVSVIDTATETRYVPGTYQQYYAPFPRYDYYGRFWGYYSYRYPMMYTPGYYESDHTYYMETNLYDEGSELLVWSAQSEAYDPPYLERFSREFAKELIARMRKDGVL